MPTFQPQLCHPSDPSTVTWGGDSDLPVLQAGGAVLSHSCNHIAQLVGWEQPQPLCRLCQVPSSAPGMLPAASTALLGAGLAASSQDGGLQVGELPRLPWARGTSAAEPGG